VDAQKILIAFNVNLASERLDVARRAAAGSATAAFRR
jgi:hypothetical protein